MAGSPSNNGVPICDGDFFHQPPGFVYILLTNPSRAEGNKGGGYNVNEGCRGGGGAGSG